MEKIYNVSVLGANNGFWKWLVAYICENFSKHISLTFTGRSEEVWKKIVSKLSKQHKNLQIKFCDNNIRAVQDADIVIYALPISSTQKVIEETLPHIKSGAIVWDVTSIKSFPSDAMTQRQDIIVIPTHPMFGPYIQSIAGQIIVLTAENSIREHPAYVFLKTFLLSKNAKVIEEDSKQHDRMMAVVQWLTHLNMFVLWKTLQKLDASVERSMDFVSPIYKLLISSVGRYLWQSPQLYADIQMYNSEIEDIHKAFTESALDFQKIICEKNQDAFLQYVTQSQEHFWKNMCERGQKFTDKLIYFNTKQLMILEENIGKEIELVDIYTGVRQKEVLDAFDQEKIYGSSGCEYQISHYDIQVII